MSHKDRFLAGDTFKSPSGHDDIYRFDKEHDVLNKSTQGGLWKTYAIVKSVNTLDFDAIPLNIDGFLSHHWIFSELQFIEDPSITNKDRFLAGDTFTLGIMRYKLVLIMDIMCIYGEDINGVSHRAAIVYHIDDTAIHWNTRVMDNFIKGLTPFNLLNFEPDQKGGAAQ